MNDSTQTLIRSILKIGGGFLIAKGLASDSQVETIGAGILALAAVIWGLFHRTKTPTPPAAVPLLALAAAIAISGAAAGCGTTTPATVAYQTEGTTITTVDTAMQAWRDWVNAGNASSNQVAAVHQAYNVYYTAQLTAHAALDAWLSSQSPQNSNAVSQATASASQAAVAVVTIIKEFSRSTPPKSPNASTQ